MKFDIEDVPFLRVISVSYAVFKVVLLFSAPIIFMTVLLYNVIRLICAAQTSEQLFYAFKSFMWIFITHLGFLLIGGLILSMFNMGDVCAGHWVYLAHPFTRAETPGVDWIVDELIIIVCFGFTSFVLALLVGSEDDEGGFIPRWYWEKYFPSLQ